MLCPMSFNNPNKSREECECQRYECARWNARFAMCSDAVDAYLKGIADGRKEMDVARADIPGNQWREE